MFILGLKIQQLPYFGHNKNFPQKMGCITFMCLINLNFMLKKSEKLMDNPEEPALKLAEPGGPKKTSIIDVSQGYKYVSATQPVITCSKLTIGALEQGAKYVQN